MLLTHEIAYCMHDINPSPAPAPLHGGDIPLIARRAVWFQTPKVVWEPDLGERFRVAVRYTKLQRRWLRLR